MKSEPLSIHDKKFLINRLVPQAPTGTLIREFFKNADESASLAPEGNRYIEIYPVEIDGVSKLAFWNTGIGTADRVPVTPLKYGVPITPMNFTANDYKFFHYPLNFDFTFPI